MTEWCETLLLLAMIAFAFYTDLRTRTIPNALNAAGALAGILLHFGKEGPAGLLFAFAGGAAVFLVVFVLHAIGAVGAGDVKWFAAVGTITGARDAFELLLYAMAVASVIALGAAVFRRPFAGRIASRLRSLGFVLLLRSPAPWFGPQAGRSIQIPFMIAVAPAFAGMWWLEGGLHVYVGLGF